MRWQLRLSMVWGISCLTCMGQESLTSLADANYPVELSAAQASWLDDHPNVRLSVDPAWPPYEFYNDAGVYKGIAADYVRIINRMLGTSMAPEGHSSWADVLEKAQRGQVDVLPCVAQTQELSGFLSFTKPYMRLPIVFIARKEAGLIVDDDDLEHRRMAVLKGHVIETLLRRDHPDLDYVRVDGIDQALRAVSERRADVFANWIGAVTYSVRKLGLDNLKVAGNSDYELAFGFGVRQDWPELVAILNQCIEAIPDEQKHAIRHRWLNLHFEPRIDWAAVQTITIALGSIASVIIMIVLIWNRRLSQEITQRRQVEDELREHKDHLQASIDNMPNAYVLFDPEGRVMEWNQAAERIFGYSQAEMLGESAVDFIVPEAVRPLVAQVLSQLEGGKTASYSEKDNNIRKDGKLITCQWHNIPLVDQGGKVFGILCMAEDITERKQAETALQESEEKYRLLFDSMLDGYALHEIICDEQGQPVDYRFLEVNPSFERLTGLTREAIVGQSVFEVLPDTEAYWIKTYGRVALEGESIRFENYAGALDKHFEIMAFCPQEGQFACIFKDISARKQAEAALQNAYDALEQRVIQRTVELSDANHGLEAEIEQRKQAGKELAESEGRYRLLVETMGEGLGRLDAQGRISYVNPRLCQMLGYSEEELLGTDAKQHFDSANQAILADQLVRRRQREETPYEIEWTRKDGSKLCTLLSPRASYHGDQYAGSFAVITDVTPLKQTEQALRIERDKARKFFDIAGTMLTVIGPDQRVRLINQRGCEILGLPYEEIVGSNWFDRFLPARFRKEVKQVFDELVKGNIQPVEFYENPVLTADGQERIIAWHNTTLTDEQGNLMGILGSGEDITEERQAQAEILKHREQLRSLASRLSATEERVRTKAATILHDSIGQNLVSCRLLLGAERQADLAPNLDKTLGTVIDILEHATEETRELTFDLASPTLYKLGLIPALEEWLIETIQAQHGIYTRLENRGISDSLDEASNVTAFRSVREISFNAVKHAQAQHIEVCVEASDNQLLVTVLDDGIGFDYEQVETGATPNGHFGLFSIRERLEHMGGRFQIETAPGHGTKVQLTIPVSSDNLMNEQAKETTDDANAYTLG